jgi:hypothetical protein|tara:strand:- start:2574 stop:2822 length:249 start_codon:yes stop_codon:yes gene_type:complete
VSFGEIQRQYTLAVEVCAMIFVYFVDPRTIRGDEIKTHQVMSMLLGNIENSEPTMQQFWITLRSKVGMTIFGKEWDSEEAES